MASKEQQIRDRAHALWEEAGRPEGQHEAHWNQAVQEIEGQSSNGEAPKAKPKRGSSTKAPAAAKPQAASKAAPAGASTPKKAKPGDGAAAASKRSKSAKAGDKS